jgi:signal transduction histidine kinase
MAVPVRCQERLTGYFLVSSARRSAFRQEDAQFLLQVVAQVAPVLEHIGLVDRMASDAAEDERQRIARSVHDRVIQPYIGLQMGLCAVRGLALASVEGADPGTLSSASRRALDSLDQLVEMAREGVEELRRYVQGLQLTAARGGLLVDALLRFAARFESVTGIRIHVIDNLRGGTINDRLAGEVFQMATEALSNVRRHTTATSVTLTVEPGTGGSLAVRIENSTPDGTAPSAFVPKSIAQRAQSLGGHVHVSSIDGRTAVRIEIPL